MLDYTFKFVSEAPEKIKKFAEKKAKDVALFNLESLSQIVEIDGHRWQLYFYNYNNTITVEAEKK